MKSSSRFIDYVIISDKGRLNVHEFEYFVVPVYNTFSLSSKHQNNMQWIEESLIDYWTWFVFAGYPKPGISYCFKSKIDAGIFTLCKCSSMDGFQYDK